MISKIERQKVIWIYFVLTSRGLNLEILGFPELFWFNRGLVEAFVQYRSRSPCVKLYDLSL
jgi:hypothetical protein